MTRRTVAALVVILAAVFTVAVNAAWRVWHNTPPYGPELLAAAVTLREISYEEAKAAVGPNAPPAYAGDELVLGTVTWRRPPRPLAGGRYAIYLIDKRGQHKPEVFSYAAANEWAVSIGSDGVDSTVARAHPWLAGAGAIQDASGQFWSTGHAMYVHRENASPLTFVALFPHIDESVEPQWSRASAPVALSDLLVGLVYIGPDRQVFWAQRLYG